MKTVIRRTMFLNAIILQPITTILYFCPYENETLDFWMPVAAYGLQQT